MKPSSISFLTIITRDYYWWAKTWADSVAEHHPDATIHIAIADKPDDQHLEALNEFEVLQVGELSGALGIENYPRMTFQYTPFELTCALKPFLTRFLLQNYSKVIYLDADTFVYRRMDEIIDQLDTKEIVATPHLLQPSHPGKEASIRNAGTLNGGFISATNGSSAGRFLDWWAERCRSECCVDPYAGKFVDQSWLDLALQFFDGFDVLRDETFNVAYWNLATRKLAFANHEFLINGKPLTFFHFSGFDPKQSEQLSRFESITVEGDLGRLIRRYRSQLIANRIEALDSVECEFTRYHDGTDIDPVHREAIRSGHPELIGVDNPFDTQANPDIQLRLESIREQLVLARKHWQLDELQKLANIQTEWIQKHSQRRLDKKLVQACRSLFGMMRGRRFDPTNSSGSPSKHGEAA